MGAFPHTWKVYFQYNMQPWMCSELKQGATSPQVSHFITASRRMPVSLPESLPVILTNSFSVLYRTSPKNSCELPAYFFNPFLITKKKKNEKQERRKSDFWDITPSRDYSICFLHRSRTILHTHENSIWKIISFIGRTKSTTLVVTLN